jgi:hypothetical protein
VALLPRWPDSILPAPSLSDNLSVDWPEVVTRTDFDQGASRQRSNWQSGATTQWIMWPMNAVQLRIFHGFWRGEINNGSDYFTLPIFADDDYQEFTVRFVAIPRQISTSSNSAITRQDGEWMYAAVVETMDETAPDETETASLMLTYGQCALDLGQVVSMFRSAIVTLSTSL